MGAQTNNAITALQSMLAVITNIEAGSKSGDAGFDATTRTLLTEPRFGTFVAALLDFGSRASQNSTQAARGANNSPAPAQEAIFTQITNYTTALNTHINTLQNPNSIPRRQQNPLL